ncbi:uncharacterized protein L203_104269 [Cryptococcus depauperatus CBS 7841]|uniref:Guanyl nucleotide exchange factor Sql2 n=1 Tax=Cryptococcus depauperatus CBS 7841 TaxID=1295531 RepID=A0AAJ8M2D8_9TREE
MSSPTYSTKIPSYAQAIHHFDPSVLALNSASSANLYLDFKAGQLIRVHVKDATGWWDGEVVHSPSDDERATRRGWFPSNYIQEVDSDAVSQTFAPIELTSEAHGGAVTSSSQDSTSPSFSDTFTCSRQTSLASSRSHASEQTSLTQVELEDDLDPLPQSFQLLIQPIVQSLTLLDSAIHSNRKTHIQPSTACVISSIRAALAQTDCLSKESPILASWPNLAKERKIVLVELSRLVNCARTASGMDDHEGTQPHADDLQGLEELAKSARGVFASIKRFLHYATRCGVHLASSNQNGEIVLSATSSVASDVMTVPTPMTSESQIRSSPGGNKRLQETFKRRIASIGDLRAARSRQRSNSPPPLPTGQSVHSRAPSQVPTPISATFSNYSDVSSPSSVRSFHERRMQGSMDSVFSHVSNVTSEELHSPWQNQKPMAAPMPSTASVPRVLESVVGIYDAIGYAEDALLSIIAAFIGHIHSHHIGSHPSSHAGLIEMTRETIDSVREVLTVVETVGSNSGVRYRRPKEVVFLRIAKDQLYEVAGSLVESAEIVAHAPFSEVSEESYDREKTRLLQTATGTLRAGTECIRLLKHCVPKEDMSLFQSSLPHSSVSANYALSPRSSDEDFVPRDKVVGTRSLHTLSGLHRKATSLEHLQKRYQEGEQLIQTLAKNDENETESKEKEELVQGGNKTSTTILIMDEKQKLFPTPTLSSTQATLQESCPILRPHHPAHEFLQAFSETSHVEPRTRSVSMKTPVFPRIRHHSPSRSADLDKFTSNLTFVSDESLGLPSCTTAASARLSVHTQRSSSLPTEPTNEISTKPPCDATPVPKRRREKTSLGLKLDIPLLSVSSQMADLALNDISEPIINARPKLMQNLPTFVGDIDMLVKTPDFDTREITFNSEGNMIGASLAVLVEKMTPHDGPVDPTFSDTFWYTFRLFTTPKKLFDALLDRWNLQRPELVQMSNEEEMVWKDCKIFPLRLRIFNFLKSWLELHWRPVTDQEILHDLKRFADEEVLVTLPTMAQRFSLMIDKKMEMTSSVVVDGPKHKIVSSSLLSAVPHSQTTAGLPPTPLISKNLHAVLQKSNGSININITEFDVLELARQLTIIVSKIFRQVLPEDLLMTGKKTIPELKALSTHSNQVTGWVADSVLNERDAKKRATLLKYFIKLADKCLMINNFFTLFAVLAGLNSSTILRLKKTWGALSAKYHIMIERLRTIIEHTKNHATYRSRLRDASSPCLPFLGLILTDITFIFDGNSNTRPSSTTSDINLINYDKYAKLGKIAMEFKRYQEPFNIQELQAVQAFLHNVLTERGSGSIDALYRKSLMLEPRQGSEKLRSNVEKPNWLSVKI